MNCPNCGAPLEWSAERSGYLCAHCRTSAPTAEFDPIEVSAESGDWNCPRCRGRLLAGSVGGVDIEVCGHCSGLLIDQEDFFPVLQQLRRQAADANEPPTPFDPSELHRVCQCPGCSRTMETHPYGGGGNAVIDTCTECGWIWLDGGELRRLGNFRPRSTMRY